MGSGLRIIEKKASEKGARDNFDSHEHSLPSLITPNISNNTNEPVSLL